MDLDALASVADLISYANCHLYLKQEDNIYAFNRVCSLLGIEGAVPSCFPPSDQFLLKTVDDVLPNLLAIAKKNGKVDDEKALKCQLIGLLCPPPSFFMESFDDFASDVGMPQACAFLYNYCLKSNYIDNLGFKEKVSWTHKGDLGEIEITLNGLRDLSTFEQGSYPPCPLCRQNVGLKYREALRQIEFYLNDQSFMFRFSPFNYFNEHFVLSTSEHIPHTIDKNCFSRFLEFLDMFPHYFIGSNCPTPGLGASIIEHNHYQGGKKELALFKAEIKQPIYSQGFPQVNMGLVDWYCDVVRLTSNNKEQLIDAADKVMQAWDSLFKSKKVKTNGIAPIAYLSENGYTIDIILRKKENKSDDFTFIKPTPNGILESSGLFILPYRLAQESEEIMSILSGETALDFKALAQNKHPLSKYLPMIAQMVNDCGTSCSLEDAAQAIQAYINDACLKMLKDTSVFSGAEGEKLRLGFIDKLQ